MRKFDNIALWNYVGWVENVVDSTRFDRTERIRVICYRVDLRELKQIWRISAVKAGFH